MLVERFRLGSTTVYIVKNRWTVVLTDQISRFFLPIGVVWYGVLMVHFVAIINQDSWWYKAGLAGAVLGTLCAVRTVLTDPGYLPAAAACGGNEFHPHPFLKHRIPESALPRAGNAFCEKCCHRCPSDSCHCSLCGICVLDYHHHCGVLGICVGQRNICSFLGIEWFAALTAIVTTVGVISPSIHTLWTQEGRLVWGASWRLLVHWPMLGIGFMASVACLAMALWHTVLQFKRKDNRAPEAKTMLDAILLAHRYWWLNSFPSLLPLFHRRLDEESQSAQQTLEEVSSLSSA